MLLNELAKNEKNAFISLSVHTAKANGVLDNQEEVMIREYCKEMEINIFDMNNVIPLEEVYEIYSKSDLKIKKIVFLEILGLAYADGTYDGKENTFISEFANRINLPDKDAAILTELILKYLDVLGKIGSALAI